MILCMPTLEFLGVTPVPVGTPGLRVSVVRYRPLGIQPGLVSISVSGVTTPASSAAATVSGFNVDPGSIRSVTARLRCDARWPDSTALGLYDGRLAIASTSPVCTSSTTADALSARSEEHTSELQSLMRISYA